MITKNPFGVGVSGEEPGDRCAPCTCCGLEFTWRAALQDPTTRTTCGLCKQHAPDGPETPEGEAARCRAAAPRLLKRAEDATAQARRSARQMQRTDEDTRRAEQGTARAYEQQRLRRSIVVAMTSEHLEEKGRRCSCGRQYPCPTVVAGRRIDPPSWPGLDATLRGTTQGTSERGGAAGERLTPRPAH